MYDETPSIFGIILALVVLIFGAYGLTCCSRSTSRNDQNMIQIKDRYCYDRTSHIIYIESHTGHYGTETTYTPYYDADGNLCKYDVASDKWIAITEVE